MSSRVVFFRPSGLIGLLLMIAVFVGLYFLAVGVFKLLWFIAPALIILAAIINYKTLVNFVRYMFDLLRRKPIVGIIGVLLCVVGYPILFAMLFGKSILDRKVRKLEQAYGQRIQDEYVEFEEVVRKEDDTVIELPPLKEKSKPEPGNPYKDLFG